MHYFYKPNILLLYKRSLTLFFCVIIIICISGSQKIYSQKSIENKGESNIGNYSEEIYIRTDRDTYITGEQVWFKVYQINGLTHSLADISKVVYVELLDKNGFPLKQLKVITDANSGSSVFTLPDNISSDTFPLICSHTETFQ
jgi:uncharacterized protein YfaS (alpha-2-macroglobulin family)